LATGDKLKRAAIILFGKDPNKFYTNIKVKIGRFGINDADLRFHEVLEGNILELLKQVPEMLNLKFLTRPIIFEGLRRIEKDTYPTAAIREMLLNALVHRNYIGSMIQIRVYDDKLTIWNEGNLPEGMTIASLKGHHVSRPRNPLIADVCFKAGFIDSWGRGTLKIFEACENAGLPEATIASLDGGILVTLHNDLIAQAGGQAGGQVGGQAGGQAVETTLDLTDKQKIVFTYIIDNPKISRKELSKKLGINESAVQKHIESLKRKGAIERKGKTSGVWKIIE
jgi:ATP-dependent DNA helicase RecG